MKSLNKVMLIGNLGRDPEMRTTASGMQVANFSVATSESFNDRSGNRQERTEWHRIVMFGKLAEIAGQYLNKGHKVYIEGRLQTREWEDKQGQRRQTTEVVATDMVMLGGGRGSSDDFSGGGGGYRQEVGAGAPSNTTARERGGPAGDFSDDRSMEPIQDDDDLPF